MTVAADLLQDATFEPTGGRWQVTSAYLIHLDLGTWHNEDQGLAEAELMRDQFVELKRRLPTGQRISAVVDLARIHNFDNAHLAMLQIYAEMTKDPVTARVAIVHATGMQKTLIVPLIKLVIHNRQKVQFFDDLSAAEAWAREPLSAAL